MSTNTHTLLCRYACWGYDALVSKANAPEGVMAKLTNDKFRTLSVMQMLKTRLMMGAPATRTTR